MVGVAISQVVAVMSAVTADSQNSWKERWKGWQPGSAWVRSHPVRPAIAILATGSLHTLPITIVVLAVLAVLRRLCSLRAKFRV